MASVPVERSPAVGVARAPLHPLHAFFLAATVPPFLGAALSDYGYYKSQQVDWSNFASWQLIGGLVFCGLALACALFGMSRAEHRGGGRGLASVLLLAVFVLGIYDCFVHARDAFASMPTALVVSVIVALLACAAAWIGFSSPRVGGAP